MSINFYSTQNKTTLISSLTLPSIIKFAADNNITHVKSDLTETFSMTWKIFIDLINANTLTENMKGNLKFIEIKNDQSNVIYLDIPTPDRPLLLSSDSGIVAFTSDVTQVPSETNVTITFKSRDLQDQTQQIQSVESFNKISARSNKLTFVDWIVLIIAILLICYLIYYLYCKYKMSK
jgi:hypothetical protein